MFKPQAPKRSPERRSSDHFKEEQLNLHNRFMLAHQVTQGREASRVAFLANGGAVAALLAYIAREGDWRRLLAIAFACFAIGVASSLVNYVVTWRTINAFARIGFNKAEGRRLSEMFDPWIEGSIYVATGLFALGVIACCVDIGARTLQGSANPADGAGVQTPSGTQTAAASPTLANTDTTAPPPPSQPPPRPR